MIPLRLRLGIPACALALIAGCAATRPAPAGAQGDTNAPPAIRPLDGSVGRVSRVHAVLQFVVVDYRLNTPPRPEQRLAVYRDGVRVGELKAGYFQRETTIAADIVSGEPREGDEVRPE